MIDSSQRAGLEPALSVGKSCLSWYSSTTWRAVVSVRRCADVVILSRRLREKKAGLAFQHILPAAQRRSAGVSYQMRYFPGSLEVKFPSVQSSAPSLKHRSATVKLTRAGAGAEKILSARCP